MNLAELKEFKEEICEKLEDESFQRWLVSVGRQVDTVMWSKGVGTSFIPYELEMAGVSPSKMTAREPANKKSCLKYSYCGNDLVRVDVFNKGSEIHEVEYYNKLNLRVYSLRVNRHDEILWIKAIEMVEGEVVAACRVDSDLEYWTFGYSWSNGQIEKILTYSSNSLPGLNIYPQCSTNGHLTGLYFIRDDKKIFVYEKTSD